MCAQGDAHSHSMPPMPWSYLHPIRFESECRWNIVQRGRSIACECDVGGATATAIRSGECRNRIAQDQNAGVMTFT